MNPLEALLGIPVHRSRRVEIGEMVFAGEGGLFVHPVTLEKLHDRSIEDWEAVRRAAARSFDERWSKVAAQLVSDSLPDRAQIWKADLRQRLAD